MDPKQLSKLDPKLKAAYERIMNSEHKSAIVTPRSTKPGAKAPTQSEQSPIKAGISPESAPIPGQAGIQKGLDSRVKPRTVLLQDNPENDNVKKEVLPKQTAPSKPGFEGFVASDQQKSKKILPALYILLGVLFLAAYVVFWLIFFKIKLPFLP